MTLPLRWMLILPMVAVLALSTVGLVAYVDYTVGANLLADLDREVSRAAVGSRPQPESDEVNDSMPQQLNVAVDGTVTPPSRSSLFSAADIATLTHHPGEVVTVGGDPGYRSIALPDSAGGYRVFALSLRPMRATVDGLRAAMILAGLLIFGASAFVIWLASARVTKPVKQLATTAEAIAQGDLSVAVPVMNQTLETQMFSLALRGMITQLSEQLRERDDALVTARRATAEQERVLAEMAHELITPLTALVGYCQLYERGMLQTPESVDHAMSRIGAGAQRLTVLVQAVLKLGHAGATSKSSWSSIDLRDLVDGVCSDLSAAFRGRPINLELPTEECTLWCDPEALQQVLLNVGANACRHTPVGTSLTFAVDVDPQEIEVRVIDHGPGIAVEERERVFDPFYRVEASASGDGADAAAPSGLGLGLAITRAVVVQHEGTIEIVDTPGGGATVIVRLRRTPVPLS